MKRSHLQYYVTLCLIVALSACDSRKEQMKEADRRLMHIEKLLADNALNAAKIELDSIHELFPRLVEKRRVAAALQDTIARREHARSLAYCRGILPQKEKELNVLKNAFRFEKNSKYQTTGNFVYKTLVTDADLKQSFLKPSVDEDGNLLLQSKYVGPKIGQTSLSVISQDLFAHTDTLSTSSPAYLQFDEEGGHWEMLTLRNEEEGGVLAFVAQHTGQAIKVVLSGSRNYSYMLSPQHQIALRETYRLWMVMKDIAMLRKEIKKSEAILDRIKHQQY